MGDDVTYLLEKNIDRLTNAVYSLLCEQNESIREYDLLQKLKEMELPLFGSSSYGDTLDLFRCHFILFHILYLLRDKLFLKSSTTIDIDCLGIKLIPVNPNTSVAPAFHDGMRDYYLDLNNLRSCSRHDAENMVKDFWKMYYKIDGKSEALTILGLEASATEREIKRRYRILVRKHHPDFGGDPAQFRKIKEAASSLLEA